ncbi:MAG: hypothetical protein JWL89_209 [Candidatus Saccharibacteria bacterium]|nr:hypothetical protein [Candidatus Saccharibacteria bacterium]
MQEVFALISAILILVAAPPYVIDTLKGKTKPERVTWLIFSVLGLVAFVSQLSLGASWSLLFSGLDTGASVLVFALALKYGVGGHTRLDVAALIIASIGVVIAVIAKEPVISLLGVVLADISGVALTVKKAFLSPASETAISWLLVGTASFFGLLSTGKFSFGLILYPLYLMIVNYAVPFAQFLGLRYKQLPASSKNEA